MPGHEIWKKGKTSPRYLPDLRGIPYNHVHTCICIYLIIIIASVRTADTNLRLAIPNDSFASHKCHLSGSPCHHHRYLTLPYLSQRGVIQVHHPFCWSHTVGGRSSPSKGFPPPLPPALLFQAISADLGVYIADELEQYPSRKVPDFSLPVKKKPRQEKLVLGTRVNKRCLSSFQCLVRCVVESCSVVEYKVSAKIRSVR